MKINKALECTQNCTNYASDIIDCFFEAEEYNIKIKMRSDQLEIRPPLIQLLQAFAKHQGYSLATLHLAIYILDIYMDNYELSPSFEHQKLIALICLLLAAKSEDLDELVPSIKDLLRICELSSDLDGVDMRFKEEFSKVQVRQAYRQFANIYCKLEFFVFESMKFNTIRPTAVTFMNIFQGVLVTENDTSPLFPTIIDIRGTAYDYLKQFLGLIIKDTRFFNILPSLLAASIVGAIRKLIQLDNYWNNELISLTRYNIDDIRPTIILLLDVRHEYLYTNDEGLDSDEDTIMKDSGFASLLYSDAGSDEEPVKKKSRLHRPMITMETF